MTKPHDLKNSRMPCVITNINRSKKVYTGCFSVTPPWEFANPQQTSMDENPKFLQAAARRFFGFSIFDGTRSKPVLMVWVPFCGQKYWGIQRGKFPWRGFPIGARSTLLAHTLRAKYSVLVRPLATADAEKGLSRGRTNALRRQQKEAIHKHIPCLVDSLFSCVSDGAK